MDRIERDKFIAWVGMTHDDVQIWGQYERLVDFIFQEFPKTKRRFDEISLPTLFTLSHAIELALKENIKFFKQYHESDHLTKFDDWTHLIKSHNLKSLASEFKIAYNKLHKKVKASQEDRVEFSKYYKTLIELIELLDRNTETYRYSLKLGNDGAIVKKSISNSKKIDFLQVSKLFDEVKTLFIGAPNSMGVYTDYIDYKKGNPGYKKGKGFLYCQKLHYTDHFLENVKERLNDQLTLISENHWFDPKTNENFEIQVWKDDIFIIAI